MRVLHLLDPHDGDEPALACRAAMSIPEVAHALWLVTDSEGERRAETLGLGTTDRACCRFGIAEFAARGMRRLLENRCEDAGEPMPDLVQCWSVRTLSAARAAFGKRTIPRCVVLMRPPLPARAPWGGLAARRDARALDDTTILAVDGTTREGWAPAASAGRGALRMRDNIRLTAPPIAPPIAPPVLSPVAPLAGLTREHARHALGLEPTDIAVLLLADPPASGDAMRFAFLVGLLHVAGKRVVGIVPRAVPDTRRGVRFIAGHRRAWGLLESPQPLTHLLGAADLAVWDIGARAVPCSGPAMILAAAGAGVPVVAAAHPIAAGALGPLAADCAARNPSSRAVAGRMLEFAASASLRSRVGQALREHAAALAGRDEFRRTLLALWRERANVPITRPGLPVPEALIGAPP